MTRRWFTVRCPPASHGISLPVTFYLGSWDLDGDHHSTPRTEKWSDCDNPDIVPDLAYLANILLLLMTQINQTGRIHTIVMDAGKKFKILTPMEIVALLRRRLQKKITEISQGWKSFKEEVVLQSTTEILIEIGKC
jgi:hypothetical protein